MLSNFTKIFFCWAFLFSCFLFRVQAGPAMDSLQHTGSNKRVLILNSYHPETRWSKEITDSLRANLNRQYPALRIYTGNLNIEEAQTNANVLLSLRAIIWQMAEEEGDTIDPENQDKNSIYHIGSKPDLIVTIGEEAYYKHLFLHIWQGKWSDIPLVCCALNDSLVLHTTYFQMPEQIQDLHAADAAENRQIVSVFKNDSIAANYDKLLRHVGIDMADKATRLPSGETLLTSNYHLTGIISEIPVRENLELLQQLFPDLQELVWIDNDYYKSAYALYRLRQVLPEILPNVRLQTIFHNRLNTDSIFDAMLQPVPHRVFITYAWNINGVYSKRPEKEIDSLFTHVLSSPILTLTERPIEKSYWLGGVHIPIQQITSPAIRQISALLNGVPVDSIPFRKVSQTEIHLNVPALKRYGLEKKAQQIEGVIYKNIPPSFYQRHERTILLTTLLLILLAGVTLVVVRHLMLTRKIRTEYENYRNLYRRLKTIYQNSAMDFALYDAEGKLLFRIIDGKENHEPCRKEDILCGHIFLHPHLKESSLRMLRQNQAINEEIETQEEKLPNRVIEKKKWDLIVKPLLNAERIKTHYMAVAIDLTPLEREREAKQRWEHIFQFASETIGVGVASYNLLDRKGFASPAWYSNLNEKKLPDQLPTYQNVCEEDRMAILDFQDRIRKENITTPFMRIIQVRGQDEKLHYVQEYLFLREHAPEKGIIAIVELNVGYDVPKQREQELQNAREQAEISNQDTEQFLANISHEIRTPLNAIVGFSSILSTSTDEEEISTLAPIIEQNNNLLMTLINNILYLSRLDSGTFTLEYAPTDINAVFSSLISSARGLLLHKDIRFNTSVPEQVNTLLLAEAQFRILMENLISNAVKFTMQGEILLGYEERGKEHYFYVKDSGCGIPDAEHENIFKRFTKLDPFTQGTGLGLALCRSIVIHQQGQIGVISEPGKGSTFWFSLPEIRE